MILGPGIRNTWSADIPWVLCEGRLFGDLTPVLANHVEVTKMSSADGKAPIAVLKLLESSAAAVKCVPLLLAGCICMLPMHAALAHHRFRMRR